MEHDKSSPDATHWKFLHALTDASITNLLGYTEWSDDELALMSVFTVTLAYWIEQITDWGKDDIIGFPQGLMLTPEKLNRWKNAPPTDYGPGWIETMNFRGDGASYSVMFRIEVQ